MNILSIAGYLQMTSAVNTIKNLNGTNFGKYLFPPAHKKKKLNFADINFLGWVLQNFCG